MFSLALAACWYWYSSPDKEGAGRLNFEPGSVVLVFPDRAVIFEAVHNRWSGAPYGPYGGIGDAPVLSHVVNLSKYSPTSSSFASSGCKL